MSEQPSKKRRTQRALLPPKGEIARRSATMRDARHALQELAAANEEFAAIALTASRFDRDRALVEPLARLSLVERLCKEIRRRYAWSPADA